MKIIDVINRTKKVIGGKPSVVNFSSLAPFAGDISDAEMRELEFGPPPTEFQLHEVSRLQHGEG